MGHIYLVRHGQASFGARDYDQLSPLGLKQADVLGHWLARTAQAPARVYSGSLKRHRQTAEACLSAWLPLASPALIEDVGFDEFNHREVLLRGCPSFAQDGSLEQFIGQQADGRRAFQTLFAASVERWIAGGHDHEYSESWSGFRARALAALERAAQGGDGDVWVFTSGGPIAAIVQHALEVPDHKVLDLNWAISNASVSQVVYRQGQFRLAQFNSIAHLALAGGGELLSYR